MITFSSTGSFRNTESFLSKMLHNDISRQLDQFGARGVDALASATPTSTGKTAESWYYEVTRTKSGFSLTWKNHNVDETNVPVAILIQYGHGTRNGGYVQGRDYINPALRPIFDEIATSIWKAVTSA